MLTVEAQTPIRAELEARRSGYGGWVAVLLAPRARPTKERPTLGSHPGWRIELPPSCLSPRELDPLPLGIGLRRDTPFDTGRVEVVVRGVRLTGNPDVCILSVEFPPGHHLVDDALDPAGAARPRPEPPAWDPRLAGVRSKHHGG